ncbi:MAG: hypothetical protein ACXADF_14915 [Candidatus Thorarchaeota archaeon]|jgi:hypothetical protein
MDDNLEAIKEDIAKARAWLENRFPPHRDEELPQLFQAGFVIEYPEPDRATVWPTVFGKRMGGCECTFRLCWKHGGLWWRGNFEIRRALRGEGDIIDHYIGYAKGKP